MEDRMNLFRLGDFTLAGGRKSRFKLECDALTDGDWECLAWLISQRVAFHRVEGVPRGGLKLAAALEKYKGYGNSLLIVDDVLTTGGSMERQRSGRDAQGFVVFQRGPERPPWIRALFQMDY
jgi:orotate phosphoribosyltransferase